MSDNEITIDDVESTYKVLRRLASMEDHGSQSQKEISALISKLTRKQCSGAIYREQDILDQIENEIEEVAP